MPGALRPDAVWVRIAGTPGVRRGRRLAVPKQTLLPILAELSDAGRVSRPVGMQAPRANETEPPAVARVAADPGADIPQTNDPSAPPRAEPGR